MLLASGIVLAEDKARPLPTVHPPQFSFFAGQGFKVEMQANRTEVHVEEPLELTIRITARGPWTHPPRGKGEKKINPFPPDFLRDDAYVELKDEKEAKDTWTFTYQLKPKHTKATLLEGVQFMYYDLGIQDFRVTERPDPIHIRVLPRLTVEPPAGVTSALNKPELYDIATGGEVLARPRTPFWTCPFAVALLLLVPPLGCLAWYWTWRIRHPDALQAARRRKSEAARLALASLAKGESSSVQLAAAMTEYLRKRFDLSGAEPTPGEAGQVLFAWGVSRKLRENVVAFLQKCDAGRFGAAALADTSSLSAEAAVLINALEAEPCAQRAF